MQVSIQASSVIPVPLLPMSLFCEDAFRGCLSWLESPIRYPSVSALSKRQLIQIISSHMLISGHKFRNKISIRADDAGFVSRDLAPRLGCGVAPTPGCFILIQRAQSTSCRHHFLFLFTPRGGTARPIFASTSLFLLFLFPDSLRFVLLTFVECSIGLQFLTAIIFTGSPVQSTKPPLSLATHSLLCSPHCHVDKSITKQLILEGANGAYFGSLPETNHETFARKELLGATPNDCPRFRDR